MIAQTGQSVVLLLLSVWLVAAAEANVGFRGNLPETNGIEEKDVQDNEVKHMERNLQGVTRASYTMEPSEHQALLPPSPEWNGTSVSFAMEPSHEWATPAEKSDFTETASYEQVMEYSRRLAANSDSVSLVTLTTLANGEDLIMLIVSSTNTTEAEVAQKSLLSSEKPNVFIHAGIHPGESSGVNAGLMLVRDMVMSGVQSSLLDKVNLLFVPIMNIQGYLRQSMQGRINQHGPNTSGRRANTHWYNLNRDYGKLDTPEVRAMVKVMTDYQPQFFIDAHSTDGMNYQYDVTWCDNGDSGLSNSVYAWMRNELTDDLSTYLEGLGHIPGPCIDGNNKMRPEDGFYPYFTDGAAYSTNYADHRQIPSYLLEIHSLKPNKQRVLGAYAFFAGVLDIVGDKSDSLAAAISADREARIDPVPAAWQDDDPAPIVEFKSFKYEIVNNSVLGIEQIIWTDEPVTLQVEMSVRSTPLNPARRPVAYYVPAVWSEVIDRLRAHGFEMDEIQEPTSVEVERYRFDDFAVDNPNREGRATASGTPITVKKNMTYVKGDVRIKTDQPLGTLAVALLEPVGESSFFYWGFFNSQMNSHEYGENYIVVPMAEQMLEDPAIAAEWDEYVSENPDYASDPDAVVDWFFERSAFYDEEAYMYPVGMEV